MNFHGAVCAEYPEPLWLSTDPAEQKLAQALCHGCPVFDACKDRLLELSPSCGVWAGEIVGKFIDEEDQKYARPGPRPKTVVGSVLPGHS